MFSNLQALPDLIPKVKDAIVKSFCSTAQHPKGFYDNYRSLRDYSSFVSPPEFKQKQLTELINSERSMFELEIVLAAQFELHQPIHENLLDNLLNIFSTQKPDKSEIDFLSQLFHRILIQLTFTMPFLVNRSNINPEIKDPMIDRILNFFQIFITNPTFLSPTFFDLLLSFLLQIQNQWANIFYNDSKSLREFAISFFSKISNLVNHEYENGTSYIFNFLMQVFSYSFNNYSDFHLTPNDISEFQYSLFAISGNATPDQKETILSEVFSLIGHAMTFLKDSESALQLLTKSIKTIKLASKDLHTQSLPEMFDPIFQYFNWTQMTFSDYLIPNLVLLKKRHAFSFEDVDFTCYKSNAPVLPDKCHTPLCDTLGSIAEDFAAIIESNTYCQEAFSQWVYQNVKQTKPPISPDQIIDNDITLDNENSDKEYEILDSADIRKDYLFYRTFLAFLLTITGNFEVEHQFNIYFSEFEKFKTEWCDLILFYVYPNQKVVNNFMIENLFSHHLLKCCKKMPQNRSLLFKEIAWLINQKSERGGETDCFLPLLNSLLIQTNDFGESLVNSSLLETLINESAKNAQIFIFLTAVINTYPREFIKSHIFTGFMKKSIFNEQYHGIMIQSFDKCLGTLCQCSDNHLAISMLTIISLLLGILHKYSQYYDIIDCISSSLPNFSSESLDSFSNKGFIELFCALCSCKPTEENIRSSFKLFIAFSRTSRQNLLMISDLRSNVFSTFVEIFETNMFDFDISDILFDFALMSNDSGRTCDQEFINPMALALIFKWAEGRENESKIIERILLICCSCSINSHQLQKALIPSFILQRISRVKDEHLMQLYCSLLADIWKNGISIADAFSAMSTMKTIQFPHFILNIFYSLLSQEKQDSTSFYWLNGQKSGFTKTKIEKPSDSLSISFDLFSEKILTIDQPLIYIRNDKNESIELGIMENDEIYCEFNGRDRALFEKSLSIKKYWYRVTFEINTKSVGLLLQESSKLSSSCDTPTKKLLPTSRKKTATVFSNNLDLKNFSITNNIELSIGINPVKSTCFVGLMSTIFVFRGPIPSNFSSAIKKNLLRYSFQNLLAVYHPRLYGEKDIIPLSQTLTAEFNGFSFNSNQSIHYAFTNTMLFDSLLPFFHRLISKHSLAVNCNCRLLDPPNGQKFLHALMSIFIKLLSLPEVLSLNTSIPHFIEILSEYITKVNTVYFTPEFTTKLLDLLTLIKQTSLLHDMKPKMVEDIFLNYELISKFPPDMQQTYFLHDLHLALAEELQQQQKLESSDFLIYQLLLYFTNRSPEIDNIAWTTTLECLLKNQLKNAEAAALLGLAFDPEASDIANSLINFIKLSEKSSENSVFLNNSQSLTPFAIWASRPPIESQKTAIAYIAKKRDKEDVERAFLHSALLYEPCPKSVSLLPTIEDLMEHQVIELLPLLINISSNLSLNDFSKHSQKIADILASDDLEKNELYEYYVIMLSKSLIFKSIPFPYGELLGKKVIKDFQRKKDNTLETIFILSLLIGSEYDVDLISIIQSTIDYCVVHFKNHVEKNTEVIGKFFSLCFKYLFYEYKVKSNDIKDNILSKFKGNLCTFVNNPMIELEFQGQVCHELHFDNFVELIKTYQAKTFHIFISKDSAKGSPAIFGYFLLKINTRAQNINSVVESYVKHIKSIDDAKTLISNYRCPATDRLKDKLKEDPQTFLKAFEMAMSSFTETINMNLRASANSIENFIVNSLVTKMQLRVTPNNDSNPFTCFLESLENQPFIDLYNVYKQYKRYIAEKYRRRKNQVKANRLTIFIREIKSRCGLWFDKKYMHRVHFKNSTYFGVNGTRGLMKIDTKFDSVNHIAPIEEKLKPIIHSKSSNIQAKLITIKSVYLGFFEFTRSELKFKVDPTKTKDKLIIIPESSVLFIFKRTLSNGKDGCEIFINGNKSYLFEFKDKEKRNEFLDKFEGKYKNHSSNEKIQNDSKRYNFFETLRTIEPSKIQKCEAGELYSRSKLTNAWLDRSISTYSYVFFLNVLANRSLNDLSQYPVFPWILSDYESDTIDLTNADVYRDLSKPTWMLNNKHSGVWNTDKNKCTVHFSNPHIVCDLLKSIEPFSSINNEINKKENPILNNCHTINDIWKSVTSNILDNRELTPEFFSNEFIFTKSDSTDLLESVQAVSFDDQSYSTFQLDCLSSKPSRLTNSGVSQFVLEEIPEEDSLIAHSEMSSDFQNEINDNLPKWAQGKASTFLAINNAALESDITRNNISKWINMMFGVNHKMAYDSLTHGQLINNDKNLHTLFTTDGSVNHVGQSSFMVYPSICYKLTNESASFGIHPFQIIKQSIGEVVSTAPELPPPLSSIDNIQNVLRIRKYFALSDNSDCFLLMNCKTGQKYAIQKIEHLAFFEVYENCVFLASPFEAIVTAVFLSPSNKSKRYRKNANSISLNSIENESGNLSLLPVSNTGSSFNFINSEALLNVIQEVDQIVMSHQAQSIQSISVVGSYFVSATSDGNIRRWSLPSLSLTLMTNYHLCPVVAVAGSFEMNLIVSMDIFGYILFESLTESYCYSSAKLDGGYPKNDFQFFKNGIVALIQTNDSSSIITLFNIEGKIIEKRLFKCPIQEFDHVTGINHDQYLIIGYKSRVIEFIEIPTLKTSLFYQSQNCIPGMKFCRIRRSTNSILALSNSKIAPIHLE